MQTNRSHASLNLGYIDRQGKWLWSTPVFTATHKILVVRFMAGREPVYVMLETAPFINVGSGSSRQEIGMFLNPAFL